jgi:Tfp pilus assembly protein FimV
VGQLSFEDKQRLSDLQKQLDAAQQELQRAQAQAQAAQAEAQAAARRAELVASTTVSSVTLELGSAFSATATLSCSASVAVVAGGLYHSE